MTLYDFLYVDRERMASLYAQHHTGLLTALEFAHANTQTSGGQTDGGISVGVASGAISSSNSEAVADEVRRNLDPHDIILTDVLTFLIDGKHILSDPSKAKPGSFILLSGRLAILDYQMMVNALSKMDKKQHESMVSGTQKEKRDGLLGIRAFIGLAPDILHCVFATQSGTVAVGCIEREAFRGSTTKLIAQHGTWFPGQWEILAIADSGGDDPPAPELKFGQLAEASMTMIDAFRSLYSIGSANLSITPLLICRKLLTPSS